MKNIFVILGLLFIAPQLLAISNRIYICDKDVFCDIQDKSISFIDKKTEKGINGIVRQFDYKNRLEMEAEVLDGKNGNVRLYTYWINDSGKEEQKLKVKIPFKRGFIEGTIIYYYEECNKSGKCGNIRKTQEIKNGLLNGWEKQYDRDGNLRIEKLYKDNQIIKSNIYK